MQVLYKAVATSTSGRDGRSVSSDGVLDVKLSTPKELGGAGGAATNPEQLFAAGYSACFLGAIKYVASQQKVLIGNDAKITAEVGVLVKSQVVLVWISNCKSACQVLATK
jgi:Ohr subfamily peroxiredoxin